MIQTTEILKIQFATSSKEEILETVIIGLKDKAKKTVIVTPNPELVVMGLASKPYQDILNAADISLPDGVGIVWASKVLGKGIKARISGVDFMKSLCEKVSKQPVTIGLFGAQPGVAEETANCLRKMYSDLHISYVSDTWNLQKATEEKIDILFVALGSPKQEQWIYEHLEELPVKVVMGVGGSFDMISGKVKRAPEFVRSLGLEWLWRLMIQPWRWKRQLRLLEFIRLVLLERYRGKK
ncbi:MAG TPA: WecB/TagA/CpsF family glycosyltransferase [Candidatus Levybacteria bacterium]|nr:WecB/TagA/CpsF family glycosyltransferase [Candidatus Levybacteria bacterium]